MRRLDAEQTSLRRLTNEARIGIAQQLLEHAEVKAVRCGPCICSVIAVGCPRPAEPVCVDDEGQGMDAEDLIEIRPGVRSGKPCFRGTRITVYDVLEYMAGGMSQQELLDNFPALTPEHLRAALRFAAARERRLAGLLAS